MGLCDGVVVTSHYEKYTFWLIPYFQVRLIKELYGNQIKELYHSLPYQMVEFVLDDFDCKVIVGLRYGDLVSTIPSTVSVLAWPRHQSKKFPVEAGAVARKGTEPLGSRCIPIRLPYAEDALRTMSLPQGT
ncbi:hypothetical protein LIER_39474 [Lithospermum erythrorhizon]|uniref:Uncharacterized protein n=1 Tax=Lithospermum erythrorhizon TaxID=34254 RepID=A0AAV3QFH9_LITER